MSSLLPIIINGVLERCPHQGCNHTCCEFANGNFIVLYPGELERAEEAGLPITHLQTTPDGAGGYLATCHAKDKACCDGGYKPLDCASYPLFPVVCEDGSLDALLKGSKCPLQAKDLTEHREWVQLQWTQLASSVENLKQWLHSVQLVGYEPTGEF